MIVTYHSDNATIVNTHHITEAQYVAMDETGHISNKPHYNMGGEGEEEVG